MLATGARWAQVTLVRGPDHGPVAVEAGDRRAGGGGEEDPAANRYPVRYRGGELGFLSLSAPRRGAAAEALACHLARHLMRLRVARRAEREHGREVVLVGASGALAEVDHLLEAASASSLPVLLLGPAGSEVERLGLALHLLAAEEPRPFVQLHCGLVEGAQPERGWLELFRQARGGTLLLAHLEDLQPRAQHGLLQFLETGNAARSGGPRAAWGARLVVSARDDLAVRVESGALNDRLVAALDVLRIVLPPLRRRRADVPALVQYFLRRYSGPAGPAEVSPEAVAACVAHDWPGDRLELARIVARSAVTAAPAARLELHHVRDALAVGGGPGGATPAAAGDPSDGDLAEELLAGAERLHPALRQAVQVIVQGNGDLSLGEVAEAAHVSKSHLSHLFKREMGTSFTKMVTALRVARAKRILRDDPWLAISAVASRAGFGQVRQLERAFRREAGCTPSAYRRRVRRRGLPRQGAAEQDPSHFAEDSSLSRRRESRN